MSSSSEPVIAGGETPAHTASTTVVEVVSGSHVLTVRGYSVTVGLDVDKIPLSDSFSVGGHAWNMVYSPPDGHGGGGDWISVGLILRYPAATKFNIRCTFSLLDDVGEAVPRYTTECRTATCFDRAQVMAFPKFIKRAELEESVYLKDDCFSVKCDMTVTKIRTEDTAQFVMVPPSDMHEHFGRILETGKLADVIFEVSGGEKFAAHWCLLAARSSVFMEQFLHMKESADPRVRISDMESTVFRVMLRFIYTDLLPELDDGVTMEMAQRLFVAAGRYNLHKLRLICENLLCNCIDTSNIATALLFAEQHGCVGFKKACFKFLASFQNLKAMIGSDGFEKLKTNDPNILEELVANVNAP